MARIFDIYNTDDEGLAKIITERNFSISVAGLRGVLDILLQQEKNSPAFPGAKAPDFKAEKISANGERHGENFQLSSLAGRVTALMFGSYSCPSFSGKTARHQEIYAELQNKAEFVCVYTNEAHPADGPWPLDNYDEQGVELTDHKNLEERATAAKVCKLGLGLTMPMVLDNIDDEITRLYNGSPERLYVINTNGVITYRSSIGPFDMEDVENWYSALQQQVEGTE